MYNIINLAGRQTPLAHTMRKLQFIFCPCLVVGGNCYPTVIIITY